MTKFAMSRCARAWVAYDAALQAGGITTLAVKTATVSRNHYNININENLLASLYLSHPRGVHPNPEYALPRCSIHPHQVSRRRTLS